MNISMCACFAFFVIFFCSCFLLAPPRPLPFRFFVLVLFFLFPPSLPSFLLSVLPCFLPCFLPASSSWFSLRGGTRQSQEYTDYLAAGPGKDGKKDAAMGKQSTQLGVLGR